MTNPTRSATIRWSGDELVFEGAGARSQPIILDGDSKKGPSPMEALLLSVGGCMGVDIKAILEKGRVPLEALEVELEGQRAPDPPQRFLTLRMDVRVKGPDEEQRAKVERAVQLSRDKYCSVFHSLQPDLKVTVAVHFE